MRAEVTSPNRLPPGGSPPPGKARKRTARRVPSRVPELPRGGGAQTAALLARASPMVDPAGLEPTTAAV